MLDDNNIKRVEIDQMISNPSFYKEVSKAQEKQLREIIQAVIRIAPIELLREELKKKKIINKTWGFRE